MTKPLIALPCTAQELENALHAVCDHDGLWDAKVRIEEVFEPIANAPSYVGSRTYVAGKAYKRVTRLVIETKEKEPQHACIHCANKDCKARGNHQIVVCNHFIMKGETK